MKQWRCTVCGYIHSGNNPPSECPVCGVGPDLFEQITSDQKNAEWVLSDTDHQSLQGVLFKIPAGLFLVSSFQNFEKETKYNALINNTVFQVTDHPLQVMLGIDKKHLTTEYILNSGVFAVNFLRPNQLGLVKRFGYQSGREVDKFHGITWRRGISGAPLLEDVPGFFECRMEPDKTMDAGTHWVMLGQVIAGLYPAEDILLTYQEYRQRKNEVLLDKNG